MPGARPAPVELEHEARPMPAVLVEFETSVDGLALSDKLSSAGGGATSSSVRAIPGRLSALSVFHSKSFFAWWFCMGAPGA